LIDGIDAVTSEVDRNGLVKPVNRRTAKRSGYFEDRWLGVGDLRANSDNGKSCSRTTSAQTLDSQRRNLEQ
jgi:hypothetical protein